MMKRGLKGASLLVLLGTSLNLQAACQHFSAPEIKPGNPPTYDGMGAFGPLHNTLSLDCLRYLGQIEAGKRQAALVEDDKGNHYTLRVGSYLGENNGVLRAIFPDRLLIEQNVVQGEQQVSREVALLRTQKKGQKNRISESALRRQVLSDLLFALVMKDKKQLLNLYVPTERKKAAQYLAEPGGLALLQQYYGVLNNSLLDTEKKLGEGRWELTYLVGGKTPRRFRFVLQRDRDRYRIVKAEQFTVM